MLERFKETREGDFRVNLSAEERDALARVPLLLRSLLEAHDVSDPAYGRLFPHAYLDDPEASAAFDEMVHDELAESRLAAADTLERTLGAKRLSEEDVDAWLGALNDARLILGARLGLTDESDVYEVRGNFEDLELFRFLGFLVSHLIVASGGPAERELSWDVAKRVAKEGPGRA